MALKHRKLFPALTATNQTTDCPEFCDPCPYNCYPYGDYYFLPPPPPPPPASTFLSRQQHISPYVFVVVSLLAAFFLVVSYYVIIAKSFPRWCGCRTDRQRENVLENNPDEEFLDENRVDHPIWFIATVGLQQSIINSITICRYKKGEGLIEGTECSVCLCEFQQDETLRLLPKCNHAFHISCIDTWLRSHTNCPLCRAHIVNDAVSVPLVSVHQNPGIPSTIGNARMENSQARNDLGNNQETNEVLRQNRVALEEGRDIAQVVGDERTVKDDHANFDNNSDNTQSPSDSDGHYDTTKNTAHPIKRSLSVDSLTAATMFVGLEVEHSLQKIEGSSESQIKPSETTHSSVVANPKEGCSSSLRLAGSSSISQCLHKSPVPMKRSLSCAGRFLSSRQNRSLNSIIPL